MLQCFTTLYKSFTSVQKSIQSNCSNPWGVVMALQKNDGSFVTCSAIKDWIVCVASTSTFVYIS